MICSILNMRTLTHIPMHVHEYAHLNKHTHTLTFASINPQAYTCTHARTYTHAHTDDTSLFMH